MVAALIVGGLRVSRTIHPFPARMAPDLALERLGALPGGSVVLDPMAGSGTVLRQAATLGHHARGFDVDPLAVMMARAWVNPADDALLESRGAALLQEARSMDADRISLPWIDDDKETSEFIAYWFAPEQKAQLRRLAFGLDVVREEVATDGERAVSDVLHVALSRTIITKEQAASLARDTSHSRPHRVADSSSYDVFEGFGRSLRDVRRRLLQNERSSSCQVDLGDARRLKAVGTASVDAIMTSPPYLNAIDYMRGHRLALVWMGMSLSELRSIRSSSIGTERGLDVAEDATLLKDVTQAMGNLTELPTRFARMTSRYAHDLIEMSREAARVLKPGSSATFVIGNSCLRGVFISNADALAASALAAGLAQSERIDRELPAQSRYLPITGIALAKRMKTETVFTFRKPLSA